MRGQPQGMKEPEQKKIDLKGTVEKIRKDARGTRAAIAKPENKGRYRNIPCHCGSGKKTKRCCGK